MDPLRSDKRAGTKNVKGYQRLRPSGVDSAARCEHRGPTGYPRARNWGASSLRRERSAFNSEVLVRLAFDARQSIRKAHQELGRRPRQPAAPGKVVC